MEAKKSLVKSNILTFIGILILPILTRLIEINTIEGSISFKAGNYLSILVILILGIIVGKVGSNMDKAYKDQRVIAGLIWIGISIIIIGISMGRELIHFEFGIFEGIFENILFPLVGIGPWIVGIFKRHRIDIIKFIVK
ncbi:MAG: hypothetical protein Q4P31_00505 [Andreesenia angusta]|nr:hypothetical protein [Andreesenia angusta]